MADAKTGGCHRGMCENAIRYLRIEVMCSFNMCDFTP